MPFSCFACPDSFSAVPRASAPVFMFCAPGQIFYVAECVASRFHVLRVRTHFRRSRGRRVPFSCFARRDSFSAVLRASGPVFMFCALGLVFGGTEGVRSRFHVLRSRTCFRRCRVRRVTFSYFARPGVIFGGPEGDGYRFHILRAGTQFWRYRGCLVLFKCFTHPDSFTAVPTASGPIFKFCAPTLVFGCTVGIGSRFHVLRSRTHFRWYRGRWPPVFNVLCSRTHFLRYRRFGGTEGVGSHFHVLYARTPFRRY
jgi:hypothetical protein